MRGLTTHPFSCVPLSIHFYIYLVFIYLYTFAYFSLRKRCGTVTARKEGLGERNSIAVFPRASRIATRRSAWMYHSSNMVWIFLVHIKYKDKGFWWSLVIELFSVSGTSLLHNYHPTCAELGREVNPQW